MNIKSEIIAWATGALTLGVIVLFTLTGHPVPSELWATFTLAVGGALGLASPNGAASVPVATAELAAAATTASADAVSAVPAPPAA